METRTQTEKRLISLFSSILILLELSSIRGHYCTQPIRVDSFVPSGTNEPIIWPDKLTRWRFDVTRSLWFIYTRLYIILLSDWLCTIVPCILLNSLIIIALA